MWKSIILLALLTSLWGNQYSEDITGKWVVESVDVSKITRNLTAEEKSGFNKSFVKPLTNAVFDFSSDHHFYLSANLKDMPKNYFWEYNKAEGTVKIKEYRDPKGLIMAIKIIKESNNIYFSLEETPVLLKVHKKEE